MYLELHFQLKTTSPIPVDHAFALYAGLSRLLPSIHAKNGVGLMSIHGRQVGDRLLALLPWSRLVLRTESARISELISLAGAKINIAGTHLRIGVPTVHEIVPAPVLRSRLVTIRNGTEPIRFQKEIRRKLDCLAISQKTRIVLPTRNGREIRRTLRIKDKEIVGYEVVVEGLAADESLALQANNAPDAALRFGRTHMGCGLFVPFSSKDGQ